MTREQHLKAIWVVSSRKIGNRTVLVMLCSGPDCGGAEILAQPNAADVAAEAHAHVDKMAALGLDPAVSTTQLDPGGGRASTPVLCDPHPATLLT